MASWNNLLDLERELDELNGKVYFYEFPELYPDFMKARSEPTNVRAVQTWNDLDGRLYVDYDDENKQEEVLNVASAAVTELLALDRQVTEDILKQQQTQQQLQQQHQQQQIQQQILQQAQQEHQIKKQEQHQEIQQELQQQQELMHERMKQMLVEEVLVPVVAEQSQLFCESNAPIIDELEHSISMIEIDKEMISTPQKQLQDISLAPVPSPSTYLVPPIQSPNNTTTANHQLSVSVVEAFDVNEKQDLLERIRLQKEKLKVLQLQHETEQLARYQLEQKQLEQLTTLHQMQAELSKKDPQSQAELQQKQKMQTMRLRQRQQQNHAQQLKEQQQQLADCDRELGHLHQRLKALQQSKIFSEEQREAEELERISMLEKRIAMLCDLVMSQQLM